MWNAENGGGGFVSSQGGTQYESPAGGGSGGDKSKSARRLHNLVPATIKQLLECETETFYVLDVESSLVSIVGLVTAVEQLQTRFSVHMDDQTGIINCVKYVGMEGVNATEIPFIPVVGTYGRIVGGPRADKKSGVKYLVIYKFLPITDMNELTAHMLEVIQLPMTLKKLKETEALKTGVGISSSAMNNTLGNSMVVGNFGGSGALGMMGGSGGGGAPVQAAKSPFNSTQKTVLNIIQSNVADSGIHKSEIMQNLKGNISQKELDKLLEDLSAEGHIYSTVDDDHFRTTD